MTYDFPASPTNGQLYPAVAATGQSQYQYNSSIGAWDLVTSPFITSLVAYQFQARASISNTDPVGTGTTSTIYLHPFNGNAIGLFNTTTSKWDIHYLTSVISFAVGTMTDNLPYDLFIYDNSGTLTIEKVAWTNASTRATALVTQNGVYVKTGELNKRYFATCFSKGSNTIQVDNGVINVAYNVTYYNDIAYCGLINYYNAVPIIINKLDTAVNQLQNGNGLVPSTSVVMNYNANNPNISKFEYATTGLKNKLVNYKYNTNIINNVPTGIVLYVVDDYSWTSGINGLYGGSHANGTNAASILHCSASKLGINGYDKFAIKGFYGSNGSYASYVQSWQLETWY